MKLTLFRHLWGVDGPWEETFARIRAAGYEGIEAPLPERARRAEFRRLLDAHGFRYVAMVFSAGRDAAAHAASFRAQLAEACELGPRLVNAHSGRDAWPEDESARFFEDALAAGAASGVPVAHETHRGRATFNPWVTDRLLARFPELRLCCDLSHWVCVCERLLDDQLDIIQRCAERCIHLHARVGYEQGPQVPDPRAPEYRAHLEAHERWWDMIWDAQAARGDAETTLTPEFGPPGYLHTLPYTQAPVADLWQICDWQAQREAERFARR
jgi:Xylose isomerase-like TIM barrel